MGMSIDEAIGHGKEQLEIFGGEHKEFIECAIDTMRKYQKIKEYISIPNRYGTMAEDCQKLEYVRKVLEDGKID